MVGILFFATIVNMMKNILLVGDFQNYYLIIRKGETKDLMDI